MRTANPQRSSMLALTLLALCAAAAGCRLPGSQAPVSQQVATCRQMTQQGVNAMERDDWKRAESLLERAVSTNTQDADARRNYAETLWHRGAKAEALAQLEEARRLSPCDPALTVRVGEVHLDMGQTDRAAELVDEALRADPKSATAWALHGRVASASGNPRAGAGRLSALTRLRPR